MANHAKAFEAEVHRGLSDLPGISMRIEDGGKVARNRQLGDFLSWDDEGNTFLWECKTTAEVSLPFANFAEHQIDDLLMFDSLNEKTKAYAVIEFRKQGRIFLISGTDLAAHIENASRKSLPIGEAEQIGKEVFKAKTSKGNKVIFDYKEL